VGFRGVFIVGFLAGASLLALVNPVWGIVAYLVHYHTFPERSWWGASLSQLGFRYSLTITALLVAGTLLNLKRQPYRWLLARQEFLYLGFLTWMVLSQRITGLLAAGAFDDPVDKMLKLAVFVMALTHVVVTPKRIDALFAILTACALYVGYEGFTAPAGAFAGGRLDGIGGPDFSGANPLAGHMAALLPIIAVVFVRSGWRGKLLCLPTSVLALNTIVQTRSRGGFLGIIVGAFAALLLAPKAARPKVCALLVIGVLGSALLMDSGFLYRMGTLEASERQRDHSAQARLRFWGAGLHMLQDHPLGVGPGNFSVCVANYLDLEEEGGVSDAHNTYIRCAAELGWPGLTLFVCLIGNAFYTLSKVQRSIGAQIDREGLAWQVVALRLSLIIYLVCGIFGSHTYMETLWWLLLLPAALERAAANASSEAHEAAHRLVVAI
jgi:hypothetical protein